MGLTYRKLFITVLLAVTACFFSGCGYNTMQQLEEAVFKSWGDVESNLQRRGDLIPNLVEVVKGYAAHEKETLEAVVEARSKATSVQLSAEDLGNPQAMQQLQAAQGALSSALSRLMVVVERYPDLKANQNFLDLQNQLEGTENRISVERKRFNDATLAYNKTRRRFPTILLANIMGFEDKPYFEAKPGAEEPPQVEF